MKYSQIIHEPKRKEFSLTVDKQRTYIQYQERDDKVYLTYSFVPPILRGQGVGKVVVEKTVAELRKQEQDIVPVCSYIRYIMMRMDSADKK